ncbi:MAG: response regulator [Spirochaetota bacterium]
MSRVLIIEDEEFYRNFLRKIVSQRHPCDTASDGEQARRLLRAKRYDVVLYDLRLPGCSGRELIRFARSEIDPDIQNIVITGFEMDWSPVEATEENVFFYLKKGSFHPQELLKLIDSALQTRESKLREREYVQRLITSEKIAQAGKLATGIAHEINNPLQSLVLVLEHFRHKTSRLPEGEQLSGELDLLERGVERIQSVVKQLQELYRIDQSSSQVDLLDAIIEKVVGFLRPICREQNTEILSNACRVSACVAENQLFYVLVNICLSLLDYRHSRISITPYLRPETALVTVKAARRRQPEGPGGRVAGPRLAGTLGIDQSSTLLQWFNGRVRMRAAASGEVAAISVPVHQVHQARSAP